METLAEEIKTANWDFNKVTKVTSEDNVIVPVPIGYTASTVEGEKSVSTGFVIKQGDNGSLTSGINEFVWVPVSNISDIYDAEHNAGQLWDFDATTLTSTKRAYPTTQDSNYSDNGFHEPDVVTNASLGSDSSSGALYDNDKKSENLQKAGLSSNASASDFKTQLQNEFMQMIDSVEKYGGFYIGRYETGNLNQEVAVVQKYNKNISIKDWYEQYRLSKTVKANDNVVTSMIWGCQWDATLRWMQTSSIDDVKEFPTNSKKYRNYLNNTLKYQESENGEEKTTTEGTGEIIPTGGSEDTKVNNIYDMAGNVWDWTIETCGVTRRTVRGGSYRKNADETNSSYRYYSVPTVASTNGNGSRLTLYIAL